MSETDQSHSKQMHFSSLLLISFVVFNLGYIFDQTIRWSDHFRGFVNGVFHVLPFGLGWCIYLVPWSLLIYGLYRWGKWRRYRSRWVLAPAVLVLIVSIAALIVYPPTAKNRFKKFAKTELPADIQNLHFNFSGGGLADYSDTYYFETSLEETERIVEVMGLDEDKHSRRSGLSHSSISILPGCPDYSSWENARYYKRWSENGRWFYYLVTDSSKTKVYMVVGCI